MRGLKSSISKLKRNPRKVDIQRLNPKKSGGLTMGLIKIINLLSYTKKSSASYSGSSFDAGYHSFDIQGYQFTGQRNPKMRLESIPFSFENLSVLDIGCNQGGMLYALSDRIRLGVGIDYDPRMINVANKMRSHSNLNHLDYYVFNLESENLDYIRDFLPEEKVDVVFLLSVCMWISNWKELIDFIPTITSKLIFETNGSEWQQLEQITHLKKAFDDVQLVSEKSNDDPSQKNRQLYYCTNGKS